MENLKTKIIFMKSYHDEHIKLSLYDFLYTKVELFRNSIQKIILWIFNLIIQFLQFFKKYLLIIKYIIF